MYTSCTEKLYCVLQGLRTGIPLCTTQSKSKFFFLPQSPKIYDTSSSATAVDLYYYQVLGQCSMVMPYCQVLPSIATKCLVNGHALLPPITKSRPVDQHSKVSSTTLFHSLRTKKVLKGLNPICPGLFEPIL